MNNELATKDLLDVKRVFDSQNVPFFLAYGVLLGAIREKDFIEYDDDIDLIVTEKLTYKQRKELGWLLYDVGFVLQENITFNVFGKFEYPEIGYNGTEKTGIIVCQKNVPVSIMFFKEEKDDLILIPKMGGIPILESKTKFFKNGKTIKFKGEKFLSPNPPEDYLEYTYGNDWKIPKRNAHAEHYSQRYGEESIKKYL